MKKIICMLLSAISVMSLLILSGCSDFEFNPIGKWKFTDDILYQNGEIIDHATTKDLLDTIYVFEKSGTGYISVDNRRSLEFTYDYDDSSITLHFPDRNNTAETVDVLYNLSDDNTQMIRTETEEADDGEGGTITYKEEYIISRY
ncbi:MAG: hypothetical protein IJ861_07410 [Clostridia bacterium]|nr:hypothetical protein [Clostridia bacterium]